MRRAESPLPARASPRAGAGRPAPESSSLESHQSSAANHERVGQALASDGGGGTVARIQREPIAKRDEACHGGIERLAIAKQDVGRADRAREQTVAAEHDVLIVERD